MRQTALDPHPHPHPNPNKPNPNRYPNPDPQLSSSPNSSPDPNPKPIPHQVRQTSRKHASSERVQRSRVALLTNTYKDGYHYWEAVDLSR